MKSAFQLRNIIEILNLYEIYHLLEKYYSSHKFRVFNKNKGDNLRLVFKDRNRLFIDSFSSHEIFSSDFELA